MIRCAVAYLVEHGQRGEPVVHHDVRLADRRQPGDRDQTRIARTAADQRHHPGALRLRGRVPACRRADRNRAGRTGAGSGGLLGDCGHRLGNRRSPRRPTSSRPGREFERSGDAN